MTIRLVESRLAGSAAHREQLEQLLRAPDDYWKAQTPIAFNPAKGFEWTPDGTRFGRLDFDSKVTPRDLETLLVVMAARMPGLSIALSVEGEGALSGLRLVHGKLEAGRRSEDGGLTWGKLPHHSTLIGSK